MLRGEALEHLESAMLAVSRTPSAIRSLADGPEMGLRVLLVADDHDLALRLSECLVDLPAPQPSLAWLATHDAGLAAIQRAEFDLYLIDCGALASAPLSLVTAASATGAVIALIDADNDPAEDAALAAGAGDVLARSEGDARVLGRGIRRAMHHARALASVRASAGALQPMIDGLSALVAVLDERGEIIATNISWNRVVSAQGFDWPKYGLGKPYLSVGCLFWPGEHAAAISTGIAAILDSERQDFAREYACTLPLGEYWFSLRAVRLEGADAGRILIAHEDITERMRDQALLRQREQEFRALAEHNPDLIARFDRQLAVPYANPAMHAAVAQLAGEQRADAADHCGPLAGIAERIRGDVAAVFAQDREHIAEYEVAFASDMRTFLVRIVPERDAAGAFETVLIIGRDITARVRTEAALRASEREYRLLMEDAADPILLIEEDGCIVAANAQVGNLLGYVPAELAGESIVDLVQREDLAANPMRIDRLGPGVTLTNERRVRHRDGYSIWLETHTKRLADGRIQVIGRDITARKATEAALRASEAEHRQLLEQAADAIFISEGLGRYVAVNAQACALTGFTREELLGMSVVDLVPPDDVGDLPRRAAVLARQRAAINEREIRHKDGSFISVEVSVSALPGGRFQAIMRDIRERKATYRALRESEARLRTLVQNAPVILFAFDAQGVFTLLEGQGLVSYGRQPGELVGRSIDDVYADHPIVLANCWRALAGEQLTVRQWLRHAFFETHYSPVFGDDDVLQGVIGVSIDLTERLQSEQALAQRESQLAEAQRIAHLGSWDFDVLTGALSWSDEVFRIFGYQPGALTVSDDLYWLGVHPDDWSRVRQALEQSLADALCYTIVHRVVRPDGDVRTVELRAEVVQDAHGCAVRRAGTILDITERKLLEERLIHDAFHDALTGLPNRVLFTDLLANALARAQRMSSDTAILFLDLDRFKDINDILGHDVGDQLLLAVAARLRAHVGPQHTIARFGGDEFTILLAEGASADDAVRVATDVIAAFQVPVSLHERDHQVSTSIGIVVGGVGYTRPEELLRDADVAMYRAKSLGKARYALFDPAMQAALAERLHLERDLWAALANDEFTLHYQPIYDLASGVPIEVEALVRWRHPQRGMIPPDRFIAIAEECGAIRDLGRWVLGEACRQGRAWLEARPDTPPLTMSVNLSTRELQDATIVENVAAALAAVDYPPQLLRLEITESAAMDDAEATLRVLDELKRLGVQVAIDDFGTGYSSLAYLQRFPVDAVKIDRAFIRNLSDDATSLEICRAITMLARALDLEVTAEGIETPQQVALVRELQCHRAQGYHYSRPRPAVELAALLGVSSGE